MLKTVKIDNNKSKVKLGIIEELANSQDEIKDIFVITITQDGFVESMHTEMDVYKMIGLLDVIKIQLVDYLYE